MGLFGRSRSDEDRQGLASFDGALAAAVPRSADLRVPVIEHSDDLGPDVLAHLERVSIAVDGDVATLTPEEFDRALTSRLVAAERVHGTGLGFSYAVRFADGVHEVLSLDLPTAVVILPDSRVAEAGHRVPALFDRARQNLTTLAVTAPVELERIGDGRGSVYAFVGESPYTASFARFLDLMVRRLLPDEDRRGGFVFAMPYRNAVIVQPCSSPVATRDAIELVPPYAQALYADGEGPISPHTYHWVDRTVTRLTREFPDGTFDLQTTPFLEQLLGYRRHAG